MLNTSLRKINDILSNLHAQAVDIDMANSRNKSFSLRKDHPIFSETLFSTNSDKLSHYVDEIRKKADELAFLISAKKTDFSYARLALIEQQITAINNAINANESQNKASKQHIEMLKHKKYRQAAQSFIQPTQALYQKLSETHEFERRLLDMLNQKQSRHNLHHKQNLNFLNLFVTVGDLSLKRVLSLSNKFIVRPTRSNILKGL